MADYYIRQGLDYDNYRSHEPEPPKIYIQKYCYKCLKTTTFFFWKGYPEKSFCCNCGHVKFNR